MNSENVMRELKIDKLVINCGCGTDNLKLDKSVKLLEKMTGKKAVRTKTQLRNATWGLRKGLPVGAKVTMRGDDAREMIKRLIEAKEFTLELRNFDSNGTVSFGISECIDIPGVEYDPQIGIIGLAATITLQRPGFRVKRRRYLKRSIPHDHAISQNEAYDFMHKEFAVKLPVEEVEE
jgi:large subunit ribosomal protein L5